MPIIPTEIIYLNKTSEMVYKTQNKELVYSRNFDSGVFLVMKIEISRESYIIEQKINYQPADSLSRMLETTQTETETVESENKELLYRIFFIWSQLGGLYSFLTLLFGSVLHKIYESMILVDMVNKYKEVDLKASHKNYSIRKDHPDLVVEEEKVPFDQFGYKNMNLNNEGGEEDSI